MNNNIDDYKKVLMDKLEKLSSLAKEIKDLEPELNGYDLEFFVNAYISTRCESIEKKAQKAGIPVSCNRDALVEATVKRLLKNTKLTEDPEWHDSDAACWAQSNCD